MAFQLLYFYFDQILYISIKMLLLTLNFLQYFNKTKKLESDKNVVFF